MSTNFGLVEIVGRLDGIPAVLGKSFLPGLLLFLFGQQEGGGATLFSFLCQYEQFIFPLELQLNTFPQIR
jgi:hypothetical protein